MNQQYSFVICGRFLKFLEDLNKQGNNYFCDLMQSATQGKAITPAERQVLDAFGESESKSMADIKRALRDVSPSVVGSTVDILEHKKILRQTKPFIYTRTGSIDGK
jgi:DNA-binding MarR family transcriptional regulator